MENTVSSDALSASYISDEQGNGEPYSPISAEKTEEGYAYAVDRGRRFVKDGRVSTSGERNILGSEGVCRE